MTQAVANGKAARLFDSEQDGTTRVERLDETADHLFNAGNRAFRVADRATISFARRSRQLLRSGVARLGPVSRRDQRIAERDQRIADRDQRSPTSTGASLISPGARCSWRRSAADWQGVRLSRCASTRSGGSGGGSVSSARPTGA
jgi:hypothetical protein